MKEITIFAEERHEKPRLARRRGCTPGNVYGSGLEGAMTVKFNTKQLKRALMHIEKNTRLKVKIGGNEYNCLIKELQTHPATGGLLHIDLQSVEENNMIRMRLPVIFKGRHMLEKQQFVLHVYVRELVVAGRVESLPDSIVVNLEGRKPGDRIMVKDIELGKDVNFIGDKNEIIAAVTVSRELEAVS